MLVKCPDAMRCNKLHVYVAKRTATELASEVAETQLTGMLLTPNFRHAANQHGTIIDADQITKCQTVADGQKLYGFW